MRKKIKNIFLSSLLVFSFILGMIPISTVHADPDEEKENGIGVLVLTDDVNFFTANFKTAKGSKSYVLSLASVDDPLKYAQSKPKYTQAMADLKQNYKHIRLIIAPIMSYSTDNGKNVTNLRGSKAAYLSVTTKLIKDMRWNADGTISKKFVFGAEPYYKKGSSKYKQNNIKLASTINSAVTSDIGKIATFITPTTSGDMDAKERAENWSSKLNSLDSGLKAYYSTSVSSTGDTDSSSTDKDVKFEKTEDLLKKIGLSEDKKDSLEKYAQYLIGLGYSEAATAGILANMRAESSFNPLASEPGGKNGGLFGFTPMTKFSDSKFNKDCTHKKGTAGGQSVCSDGECQVLYVLNFLKGAIDANAGRIHNANKFFSNATEATLEPDLYSAWGKKVKFPSKIEEVKNLDEYKKVKDPISAAAIFSICYEVCAGTYEPCGISGVNYHSPHPNYPNKTWHDFTLHEFNVNEGRLSYAEPIYEWLSGSEFKQSKPDKAVKMAEEAKKKGYLSEEELSAWTKIVNEKFINYKAVTRNSLSQSELRGLTQWENNVDYDDISGSGHGFMHFFNKLIMILAIILIVYGTLLYCAFWFDKINPLCLPFSLLGILTFNKLQTAPTEEECNFSAKNLFVSHEGSRFVNHKYIIAVCLMILIFATLILTGVFSRLMRSLINFVAGFFIDLIGNIFG